MSDTKHTPGPWSAPMDRGHTTGFVWAEEPHGGIIAAVYRQDNQDESFETRLATADANARLIAAAPDLLDALDEMIENSQHPGSSHLERAKAAVAKARGES